MPRRGWEHGERDARRERVVPPGDIRRVRNVGNHTTWSACTCVSNTATIGTSCVSASATYTLTRSTCGSTTANALLASCSPADTTHTPSRR